MDKNNKKLVLNKNTAKTLNTKTSVKTGTLMGLNTGIYGRSGSGGSYVGSIAGSNGTITSEYDGGAAQ